MVPRGLHGEQLLWPRNQRNRPSCEGLPLQRDTTQQKSQAAAARWINFLMQEKNTSWGGRVQDGAKGGGWGNGRKRRKAKMKETAQEEEKKGDGNRKGRMATERHRKGRGRSRSVRPGASSHGRTALGVRLPAARGAQHHAVPGPGAVRGSRCDVDLRPRPRTDPGEACSPCTSTGPRFRPPPSSAPAFQPFPLLPIFFFFPFHWRARSRVEGSAKDVSPRKVTAQLWAGKLDCDSHEETI